MEDPFKVLGVSESATVDDIKKAYRNLSKAHHPDKTGGDDTEFKRITTAYEQIGTEQALKRWKSRGTLNIDEDFSTYFNDFFHFKPQPPVQRMVHAILPIDLEEVFKGGIKSFYYESSASCPACAGLGGTSFEACRTCNGIGHTGLNGHSDPEKLKLHGFTRIRCKDCAGMGKKVRVVCSGCAGTGHRTTALKSDVIIPQGAVDGQQVPSIDRKVNVTLKINKHLLFERRNYDIYSSIDLQLEQVFSGLSVKAKTLHGEVDVVIPRCVQASQMLRVKQKGIFDFRRSVYGDHIIKLNIIIPKLDESQCEKIVECLNEIKKTAATTN